MSFLFAAMKATALAVALLCLSSIGPGFLLASPEQPVVKSAAPVVPAAQLRCRMYFGCLPFER